MNIAPAIFELLRTDTTVKGLVADRIYPDQIPQDVVYPAIVHFKTEADELTHKGGTRTTHKIELQIEIYCEKYGETEDIAAAVKAALENYNGTVKGIDIQSCYFNSQSNENFLTEMEAHVIAQSYLFRVIE